MDRNLWNTEGFGKGLVGQSRIAAHKLAGPIHYHLRSVNVTQAKALGIRTLPLTVEASRVRVLPANVVPVIDVFAEHNQFCARYGLPIQLLQEPVRWGTAGATLRGKQFNQHRNTSIRPVERARCNRQYRKYDYH